MQNKSLQKGAQYFVKQMQKCLKGNVKKLVQTLFSVGRQATAPLKSGRRRNSKLIPVQPTSINRRVDTVHHHGQD